jgi:UDPglucose 6-dehydrogenase
MPSRGARIATVGLWHLGSVASACLASLGHTVGGTDPDAARVRNLAAGSPPVFEPGLAALVAEQLAAGRLAFAPTCREAFADAEFIFVTFDTPVDDDDQCDLSLIENAFCEIAAHARSGVVIALMSQVPVGTCANLAAGLRARAPQLDFTLLYQPENLRLGEALDTFLRPDFLIFGTEPQTDPTRWKRAYEGINAPHLVMRWESAELAKHALNAFLATSISFVNELAELAEVCGADIREVTAALKRDRRIGAHAFLRPGPGFAGGTLGRDIQALRVLGSRGGRRTVQLDATLAVNRSRLERVAESLRQASGGLAGKRVALLGLTYKPGTSTLRRSHAIELARLLKAEGVQVAAFDPQVREPQEETRGIQLCGDVGAAAARADALVLLTPWPEFRLLDWNRLRSLVRCPLLVDTHNFLDDAAVRGAGWRYCGLGIAEEQPKRAARAGAE